MFCTYLTIYSGNKLPSFYIGYTSVIKIALGYHGSVTSKEYKSIWKQELKEHPELFKTIILTRHQTRKEACKREQEFQWKLNVIHNPLYINKAIGKYTSFKDQHHSNDTKMKMSKIMSQKYNGLVACKDIQGQFLLIPKDIFYLRDDLIAISKGKGRFKNGNRPWNLGIKNSTPGFTNKTHSSKTKEKMSSIRSAYWKNKKSLNSHLHSVNS